MSPKKVVVPVCKSNLCFLQKGATRLVVSMIRCLQTTLKWIHYSILYVYLTFAVTTRLIHGLVAKVQKWDCSIGLQLSTANT